MLKSMTGYGKAGANYQNKNVLIEVKSVNSKQLDVNCRMPSAYKEKEIEIRNEINKIAERGKVDFFVTVEQNEPEKPVSLNQSVIKEYISQIKTIASELGVAVTEQTLLAALRLPETLKSDGQSVAPDEWEVLLACVKEALANFSMFRAQEGAALSADISGRVATIETLLGELKPYEDIRIAKIRERLNRSLNEFVPAASIDSNRFEQEIIYFLEKLDVTEEKVRLKNHCEYFMKTLQGEESTGRKLGFIAQEMGREINTIGSKANDSDIQKRIVMMKDELEKIKEQLLNVL